MSVGVGTAVSAISSASNSGGWTGQVVNTGLGSNIGNKNLADEPWWKRGQANMLDIGGNVSGLFLGNDEEEGSGLNYWEQLAMQYFPEEYTVDPYYTQSQSDLYGIGSGLTTGEIPDYYKAIGEYGGEEIDNVIKSLQNDISSSVGSDIATRNVGRGGIGTTANINALNSIIPSLRYSDYERAMTGRGNLLSTGINTLEGVRTSAFNMGQAQSDFDLNRFSALLGGGFKQSALDQSSDAADASMWGGVAEGASGLLTKYLSNKNAANNSSSSLGAAGGTSSISSTMSNTELNTLLDQDYSGYSMFS